MIEELLSFAERRGGQHINSLPGCWIERVDEHWVIGANGHSIPEEASPNDCMAVTVPPFHFAVWFNGFPAGLLDPAMGGVFAAGSAANPDEFEAALRRAGHE